MDALSSNPETFPEAPGPWWSLNGRTLRWPWLLLIAGYGLSLLGLQLGSTRVLTYHEALFAQPAREMLASGQWVQPTIGGIPSTHKPPGMHWLVAVSMWISSSQSEAAARLPSVLAGVSSALVMACFAGRLLGARIGLFTGLIQCSAYYVLAMGRLAEADMPMAAAVAGAFAAFGLARIEGRDRSSWHLQAAFFASTGAAFFFKGLIGPVFIAGGVAAYLIVDQDRKGWRFVLNPMGLGVVSLAIAGWLSLAARENPQLLADQWMHHFGRFKGDLGGQKSPLFYAWSVPMIVLPWTPFAITGLVQGIRRGWHHEPIGRFLGCWLIPGLVVLCASTFKSKHYAGPLIPPLCIAAAMGLDHFLRQRRLREGKSSWVTAAAIGAGSIVAATAAWFLVQKAGGVVAVLLIAAGLSATAFFLAERRRSLAWQAGVLFTAVWVVAAGALVGVLPAHDSYRDQYRLAERTRDRLKPGTPLFVVGLRENQIFYYLPTTARRVDSQADFEREIDRGQVPEAYALAPLEIAESLCGRARATIVDRCESINRYLTERQRLTLVHLRSEQADMARSRPYAMWTDVSR